MNGITTISVLNESDAWELLEQAILNKLPEGTIQLELDDWPEFHLKFIGAKFDSSMTTSMMEAFIELQKNIYRLYAKLQYDDARSIVLTDVQRRSLDILVQLSPGSTDAKVDFKDALKKLVEGAINKMEAKHYVILAMTGAVLFTGNSAWKQYLQSQDESKKADLHIALSKEETKHLQILADATKQVPHVSALIAGADEYRNKLLKSAKSADSISVAGQAINKEQATKLVRASRSPSEAVRLDGEYRIIKVDSSNHDHFKVVLLAKDGKTFPAELNDVTITKAKNRELIQEAEWGKTPINLMVTGTSVRGEVTSAKIIDVKERFSPGS